MLRQHKLNDPMCLAKGPPNLMQRLPVLPAPPHIVPLLLRKLEAPPKCHKHNLIEKDLYQMVLHRPVEPARLIGMWLFADRPSAQSYPRNGVSSTSVLFS